MRHGRVAVKCAALWVRTALAGLRGHGSEFAPQKMIGEMKSLAMGHEQAAAAALWAERVLLQRDPAHIDHLMQRLRGALPPPTVVV